jgi:hypothetical protein
MAIWELFSVQNIATLCVIFFQKKSLGFFGKPHFFSYQVVNFCHKTEHWPFPTDRHEQSEDYKVRDYLNVTTWGNDVKVTVSSKYLGFRVYLYSQTEFHVIGASPAVLSMCPCGDIFHIQA